MRYHYSSATIPRNFTFNITNTILRMSGMPYVFHTPCIGDSRWRWRRMESGDWRRAGKLTQDRMIPCFVISPLCSLEKSSSGALTCVPLVLPPYFLTFCFPRCFFPLTLSCIIASYYSPRPKIRSHQLDSTLFCIIARLIFPK